MLKNLHCIHCGQNIHCRICKYGFGLLFDLCLGWGGPSGQCTSEILGLRVLSVYFSNLLRVYGGLEGLFLGLMVGLVEYFGVCSLEVNFQLF